MGDLQAALRHRDDEPIHLQPRNEFANGAERHAGDFHQLALSDELSRHDIASQEAFGEPLIGLRAQFRHHDPFCSPSPPPVAAAIS